MVVIADKYEVIRKLGSGGYGDVYLVRHRDLGLSFALKLLNRTLSEDPRLVDNFRREAEVLSKFAHRGSAQLRDFGKTADGLYYMTLDFCEGETLEAILKRDRWLPMVVALEITAQCLEVLHAAHQYGIVHRDIKPSNILIKHNADGSVTMRLVDFGIAKLLDHSGPDTAVSTEGFVAGTPQYMSPEQACGEKKLDHRVDIYSMGVVMYEMLTGVPPFQGPDVVSVLVKHLTQPPPPFAEELEIPFSIQEIVFNALKKNREDRYQSAELFLKQCDAVLQQLLGDSAPTINTGVRQAFVSSAIAQSTEPPAPSAELPTLLCLDDDPMVLNIVQHVFEREGYKVHTAGSFTQIHDILFREGCRVMLCDVEMPGLSGPRICQILKKSMPDLTIVLFSNVPERELAKLAEACAADAWISKGRPPNEWLKTVKKLLKTKPGK